jgi:hypothetical protein
MSKTNVGKDGIVKFTFLFAPRNHVLYGWVGGWNEMRMRGWAGGWILITMQLGFLLDVPIWAGMTRLRLLISSHIFAHRVLAQHTHTITSCTENRKHLQVRIHLKFVSYYIRVCNSKFSDLPNVIRKTLKTHLCLRLEIGSLIRFKVHK